jgi:gamma-glutamylcyclotransferase (GGCT)/AIG2-like uncharacterized protein YtfP
MRPDPGAPFRLFVYGTLMRDGSRHGVLASQAFLGPARTAPHYALLDLTHYPGLIACPDGGQVVQGELYAVEAALRPRLDAVEGAPALFRLGPVVIEGEVAPAYAYFYQPRAGGRPRLAAGRWDNGRAGDPEA